MTTGLFSLSSLQMQLKKRKKEKNNPDMLRLGLVFTSDTNTSTSIRQGTDCFVPQYACRSCVPAFMLESVVKVRPSATIFYHTIIKSI